MLMTHASSGAAATRSRALPHGIPQIHTITHETRTFTPGSSILTEISSEICGMTMLKKVMNRGGLSKYEKYEGSP